MATARGPTPPGTGVMREALGETEAKSTSPTPPQSPIRPIDADINDDRPLLHHVPLHEARLPCGHHEDVRHPRVPIEVSGPFLADRYRGPAMEKQKGDRLCHEGAPADDDRVSSLDGNPESVQDLHDA